MSAQEDSQQQDVSVTPGRQRIAKLEKLKRWQLEVIEAAKKKFVLWSTEPCAMEVGGCSGNLGNVNIQNRVIRIAPLTFKRGKREVKNVILHELIHLEARSISPGERSHGKTFKKLCLYFGLKDYGDKSWRYKYLCSVCKRWMKVHKKFKSPQYHCGTKMKFIVVNKISKQDRALFKGQVPVVKPPLTRLQKWENELAKVRKRIKKTQTRVKRSTTQLRKLVQRERNVLKRIEKEEKEVVSEE